MSLLNGVSAQDYWLNKQVWIIGASSGIGKELAIYLAKCGAEVNISARTKSALNAIAGSHAGITAYPLDATDQSALQRTYAAIIAKKHLDVVIHSAAMYEPMTIKNFSALAINKAMNINFGSVVSLVDILLSDMDNKQPSHIAVIASVAGYIGLPNALAYGASKAALINFCEGLYSELSLSNIKISLINPGFVSSPLTQKNNFAMPFIISAEKAAIQIEKGLRKQQFEIHFPKKFTYPMKLLRLLPYQASLTLLKKLAKNTHSSQPSNKET